MIIIYLDIFTPDLFENSKMEKHTAIGVDIGGSHITCAAVDLERRQLVRETIAERPVDNKGTADEIISRWSEAISETVEKAGKERIKGIGFAMPGPFDYVKGIKALGINECNEKFKVRILLRGKV